MGDEVEATYRLSGRKWQRDPQSEVKYFLSAEVVKFEVVGRGGPTSDSDDGAPLPSEDEAPGEDDVPF